MSFWCWKPWYDAVPSGPLGSTLQAVQVPPDANSLKFHWYFDFHWYFWSHKTDSSVTDSNKVWDGDLALKSPLNNVF